MLAFDMYNVLLLACAAIQLCNKKKCGSDRNKRAHKGWHLDGSIMAAIRRIRCDSDNGGMQECRPVKIDGTQSVTVWLAASLQAIAVPIDTVMCGVIADDS